MDDPVLKFELLNLRQDFPAAVKMIEEGSIDVNASMHLGKTACMYACMVGDCVEYVNALLDLGADVNATDLDSNTALHMLIRFAQPKKNHFYQQVAGRYISLAYRPPKCEEEDICAIAEGMNVAGTYTETIDVSESCAKNLGCTRIASALRVNSHITSLQMKEALIGEAGAILLGEALGTCGSLTSLYLDDNSIGNKGVAAICEGLKIANSVAQLGLAGNEIGLDGAHHIAGLLEANTPLQILLMHQNNIGDEGAKAIAESLGKNTRLSLMSLTGNNIDDDGYSILDANKSGRVAILR